MSRNGLYALVAVLIVVLVGLGGYILYEQSQQPHLAISVDKSGIKVNGNG